jgi:CHAD domain-containing protein
VAYRLRKDESVSKGLSRVVNRALRSAADGLSGDWSDEAIHDARKSIKKVRAVLQLVGDELDAGGERKKLRRASHLLSPLRDIDAMRETARTLGSRRDAASVAVPALDDHLSAQKVTLTRAADKADTRSKAARTLERLRRDARDWRWKRSGRSVIAKAITRSYKRARNRMDSVRGNRDGDAFHEWRKRVKTLWYALRLLEAQAPRLRRTIADLKRLETLLGDDHNLVVLARQVRSAPPSSGMTARGRTNLQATIERRQRTARHQALALGARLFAQSPKAFTHRLQEVWLSKRAAQGAPAAA